MKITLEIELDKPLDAYSASGVSYVLNNLADSLDETDIGVRGWWSLIDAGWAGEVYGHGGEAIGRWSIEGGATE